MADDYQDSLDFLYGRLNYERQGMPRLAGDLRLGRMRRLLKRLDDTHTAYKIVHVAGTKGKGSTATMIAGALIASGRRTGLYCSPHLNRLEDATWRSMTVGIQLTRRRVSLVSSVSPSKSCMAGVSENRARSFRQLTLRTARGDCSLASDTAAINTPHWLQSKKSQVRVPNR